MNPLKTKTPSRSTLATLLALSLTAAADPVGHAFTYQGRLNHNDAPANGSFDLKFELYSVAVDGIPVRPAVELPAQNIAGGLFTADLLFGGPELFDGTAYWVQMLAKSAGDAEYKPVPGRTPLRAAPYAIHALNAASVKDGAVTANGLANGAVTAAKLAPAAVGLAQLNAPAAPNAGQVLAFDGNALAWINPGGAGTGPWLVNGTSPYYNAGNVGIGTAWPQAKLEVFRDWDGENGALNVSGDKPSIRFNGGALAGNRTWLMHVGTSGLFGTFLRTGPGAYQYVMGSATNGNVGIGSANPQAKLEVVGDDAFRMVGYQPYLTFLDGNAGGAMSRIQGADGKLFFHVANGPSVRNIAVIDGNGLAVNGTLTTSSGASVSSLTIRGGADLAEPFAMSHDGVEPGSVVVIDEKNPGKLKASTHAYDKKVAGIVSGANGIRPGISMIQEDKLEAGENVALSGRVYVRADVSAGSIEPGDLLTTSSTAGRAMKAADHGKAQGAIIGKAMTSLNDGDGMVLVLVTLQ